MSTVLKALYANLQVAFSSQRNSGFSAEGGPARTADRCRSAIELQNSLLLFSESAD
jgi:hypothetical protein